MDDFESDDIERLIDLSSPEVRVENHQAVYDYYEHLEPNQRLMRAIHRAASLVYRPRIHFAEGAESEIADRINSDDRLIIASNHLHIDDQFPLSAAITQTETLRPLVGRTFALAKAPYFNKPYLRFSLDAIGAVPVFRAKDVSGKLKLQAAAARSLIDASSRRIIDGWNMFIFPEGTRNQADPTILGKVHGGIGRIAFKASQKVGVSVLPVALWYGPEEEHRLSPDVFIDNPIVGPFDSKSDVVEPLRADLKDSVAQAIEKSLDRD